MARGWVRAVLGQRTDPLHNLLAGAILLHSGAVDTAIRLFEQVTQMEPPVTLHAAALCGLGFARLTEGNAEAAEAHLRQAIALDPTCWEPYYRLAELKAFEGDQPEAAVSAMLALRLDESGAAADQLRLNPLLTHLCDVPEVQALCPEDPGIRDEAVTLFPVSAWGLEHAAHLGIGSRSTCSGAGRPAAARD
jgi:tetratricopeptide (TPR) repeat protein